MTYRNDYNSYASEFRWTMPKVFGLIILLMMFFVGLGIAWNALGWFGKASQVVADQVDPAVMLRRYEWFKDAAAQLDRKRADMQVYEARTKNLTQTYVGVARREWPRDDREQYNIWMSELAGVRASYNDLAAQYNAAMAKINFAFTNVGSLPKGAGSPLPREFKPYEEN